MPQLTIEMKVPGLVNRRKPVTMIEQWLLLHKFPPALVFEDRGFWFSNYIIQAEVSAEDFAYVYDTLTLDNPYLI